MQLNALTQNLSLFKPWKIGDTCYLCGSEGKVNLLFWLLNVFSIGGPFAEFAGEAAGTEVWSGPGEIASRHKLGSEQNRA